MEDDPPVGEPLAKKLAKHLSAQHAFVAELGRALTPLDVARATARGGVLASGGTTSLFYELSPTGDLLTLRAGEGGSAESRLGVENVSIDSPLPIADAVRRGETVWLASRDEMALAYPDAATLAWAGPDAAVVCLPLNVATRRAGALVLTWSAPRDWDEAERVLLPLLASEAALAFDRAKALDAERSARKAAESARERADFLRRATGELAKGFSSAEAASAALRIGCELLSAERAVLALTNEDGRSALLLAQQGFADHVLDEWKSFPLDMETPVGRALVTGTPDWIPTVEELVARYPRADEAATVAGAKAAVALPLTVSGRVIAAMQFSFAAARTFLPDEEETLSLIARQTAGALERARLYRTARESASRAEQASRAKDEFLSVVSHELRTPLNAIIGWAHLLIGPRTPEAALLQRGLEVIQRNAKVQVKLIEDILDVSRIITGKLRLSLHPVDLEPIIRLVIDATIPTANVRRVHIEFALQPDSVVLGDQDRLQQIVWNLVANAVKFTPGGGRVNVALACDPNEVHLSVSDTGRGIRKEDLPHVFERFRQADASISRDQGGLGLGLSIVRHLVEAHGGSIRAESEGLGRGAKFVVTLPTQHQALAVPPLAGIQRPAPEKNSARRLEGLRVLVVDDQADARDLFEVFLTNEGAIVKCVGSAAAALETFLGLAPDLLISDISMPGESGLALIRKIRELDSPRSQVPALATTSYARPEDVRAALSAGYQRHLAKPVDPLTFVDVVASLTGRI